MALKPIEVSVFVKRSLKDVWRHLLNPTSIQQWNQASEDWETSHAKVDLRIGGQYLAHMKAKDGSAGFDFIAVFTKIEPYKSYTYIMDDGRKVTVKLVEKNQGVKVIETFDPEAENPLAFQRAGWQAILDSFKHFVERQ